MDRLVRAVPAAQAAVAVPVADLALHRIVRPAGTELQTIKRRQEAYNCKHVDDTGFGDDRKLCVVRISGAKTEEMLRELWKSGHAVLNVLHNSFPFCNCCVKLTARYFTKPDTNYIRHALAIGWFHQAEKPSRFHGFYLL